MGKDRCQEVMGIMNGLDGVELRRKADGRFDYVFNSVYEREKHRGS